MQVASKKITIKMKNVLIGILIALAAAYALLRFSGHKYVLTGLSRTYLAGHITANIDDHRVFETRRIKASDAKPWAKHRNFRPGVLPAELSRYMRNNDGIGFLAIQDGKLLAEMYRDGYGPDSKTNSFSMAKTVVTLLLGIAIEEGYIAGVDQPLTDFLPEFNDDPNGRRASVGSLATMTSGYDWNEHYYSPFSPTVELLYTDDVEKFVLNGRFNAAPEKSFYYSSASIELLALVITRALRARYPDATLSDYLSEKLWQPLGMNADGVWHLDSSGMELAYCCISTNARNFARFGQLMLQDGQWEGRQLVPKAFLDLMRTPDADANYGYSTWINESNSPSFYSFQGHLGQYIIVVPEYDLVLVRLGKSSDDDRSSMRDVLPFYIQQALSIVPQEPYSTASVATEKP